jgi:hypothetical protein
VEGGHQIKKKVSVNENSDRSSEDYGSYSNNGISANGI